MLLRENIELKFNFVVDYFASYTFSLNCANYGQTEKKINYDLFKRKTVTLLT